MIDLLIEAVQAFKWAIIIAPAVIAGALWLYVVTLAANRGPH